MEVFLWSLFIVPLFGFIVVYIIQQIRSKDKNSIQSHSLQSPKQNKYICNRKTNVFHRPDCPCAKNKYDSKGEYVKQEYDVSYQSMIYAGFKPCSKCKPH